MTAWKDMSTKDRLSLIGGQVVETEELERVRTCLRLAMLRHGTRPDGKVHVIQGETSLGKSTAARYFMFKLAETLGGKYVPQVDIKTPNKSVEECDYVQLGDAQGSARPIVRIQVAPRATYNGMLADTIFALTGKAVGTVSTKHHRLMKLLATQIVERKTQVLIFDDAHNVARNLTPEQASLAADVFKVLAKTTRVEIVVVGDSNLDKLFSTNTELAGMRDLQFPIAPMGNPENEKSPFCRFLKSMQAKMPFAVPCDFATLDDAKKMYCPSSDHLAQFGSWISGVSASSLG